MFHTPKAVGGELHWDSLFCFWMCEEQLSPDHWSTFTCEIKSWATDGLCFLCKWALEISEAGECFNILMLWCHKSASADILNFKLIFQIKASV